MGKGAAVEMKATIGAAVKGMLLAAGRGLQAAGAVVLGLALLAWLGLSVGSGGFDEGWRLLGPGFQFRDAREGGRQLLLQAGDLLAEGGVLGLQGDKLIRWRHTQICSKIRAQAARAQPGAKFPLLTPSLNTYL